MEKATERFPYVRIDSLKEVSDASFVFNDDTGRDPLGGR